MQDRAPYSSPLTRVFLWLSGAGAETLDSCPNWERRKYVAFGATVLVPCLFAFMACAYALSTLTDDRTVIYPVAGVWAFIILSIDRALLASYRPFLSFFRKFSQFALRFVVALLMGLTIAHPLVLLLFRDTVTSVIEKDREADIEQLRAKAAIGEKVAEARIASVEKSIDDQRKLWDQTFQSKFIVQAAAEDSPISGLTPTQQQELKKSIAEATAPARDRLAILEKQSDELAPNYTKIKAELAYWQPEFEREVNGQRSGLVGLGPRARSIQDDQLAWRQEEAKRLGGLLEHLTAEKSALQSQARQAEADAIAAFQKKLSEEADKQKEELARVTALRRKVESDQADQFVTQQNQLRETIKVQIDARLADLKVAQGELARLSEDEQTKLNALRTEKRRDILTQTLALHRLFNAGDKGGEFALATYLVLTLLFMLVDTIPLMVKFFCKPGPYDRLLDRDELRYDGEHRAFVSSHGRYMQQLEAGNLIAVTRNKPLEDALIDGVEHSRAAREFLDSLIDLEKAFHEKLQLEQQNAQNAAPEKLAVLEMMKKRFYEDMHHRMELFFARGHSVTV